MKKRLIPFAFLLILMALTCSAAYAADADSGFQNIATIGDHSGLVTLTPLPATGDTPATGSGGVYPGAVRMKVTYQNPAAGSEYLLFVLADAADGAVPDVNNLAYINQTTASGGQVDFTVYPKKVDAKTTSVKYSVYLSSDADASTNSGVTTYEKIASFDYFAAAAEPDYMLGDLNGDQNITVVDAGLTLDIFAELMTPTETQRLAADVDGNGNVTVADAGLILSRFAELIDHFPAEET